MKCARARSMNSAPKPNRIKRNPAQISMELGCRVDGRESMVSPGLQSAPTNVAAIEAAVPMYPPPRFIGARLGLGDARAGGGDVQHSAAGRDDVMAAPLGAGMEDGHAGDFRGFFQSRNHSAFFRR